MKKSARRKGRVLIGTSGYSYGHWKGILYPASVSGAKMLTLYSQKFPTVEINYSFYHLPKENTLQGWVSRVDRNFQFVLKAAKLITHNKKLANVEESLNIFCDRARVLDVQLGCVLYQLPPSLHKDLDRLESFAALLPGDIRHAIEFRHNSWCDEDVFRMLEKYGIAYCIVSAPKLKTCLRVTAEFAYVRFHGAQKWYSYDYTDQELADWAANITGLSREARDVYVFFNNDYKGYAPKNALTLMEMLKGSRR